jgi:ribonuclease G
MSAEIFVSKTLREIRVARLENGSLSEVLIERSSDRGIVGNIYKGRVVRVLPGMQAAFVDLGLEKTGYLSVSNVVDPNNIPLDDLEESSNDDEDSVPDRPLPDISKLLQEGQTLMVQVVKDPLGTKGARLTGYVSLPGRSLVFLPDTQQAGVSRRILDPEERDRLRKVIEENRPSNGGFIARTVAEGASEKSVKDDMDYLVRVWNQIRKAADKAPCPSIVYADLDLPTKILRDRVGDDVERIVVDDIDLHRQLSKFASNFLPKFKKRIELHTEKRPLFDERGIEAEIERALGKKVWLKSGGYILVEETEALTTIDVNTGRFTGRSRSLEDTILQTNLEAVREIATQIRIRNLGGIIVLDFIDMDKPQNRERVYESLLDALKTDPVRTNVLPISPLGLIEMTRKRTQESLRSRLTESCHVCDGKGHVKSRTTLAYEILREISREASASPAATSLTVYCHPKIAETFAEDERQLVEELEKNTGRRISIKIDPALHYDDYEIMARES